MKTDVGIYCQQKKSGIYIPQASDWYNISGVVVGNGTIIRSGGVTWANNANAGFVPANTNCILRFRSLNPTYAIGMMGLSLTTHNPSDVPQWNWFFHSHSGSRVSTAHGYSIVSSSSTNHNINEVFEIRRTMTNINGNMQGVFTWWRSGNLIATSNVYNSGALHIDNAMYHLNINFVDIELET